MSIDNRPSPAAVTPLDRAKQISQALADAARMARFSTRGRSSYGGGGFKARRGAGALRIAVLASFLAFVLAPTLSSAVYYAFIASDQYVSQAKFSVTVSQIPQLDGIASVTGLASMAIVRDTQIVTNYIASRAAVEKLEARIDLRKLYSDEKFDRFARFDPKEPIEKFVRYWEKMATTSISMPAGIVDLSVRAFTPEDAQKIAQTVVEISEELINEQNDRIQHDAISSAMDELQRSTARLTAARLALEKARNDAGILDTAKTGEAINTLVMETRGKLLALQQEYATKSKLVSPAMPQMRILKERIDGLSAQIVQMEERLTGQSSTAAPTLSTSMTKFGELELERQISERLYAGAAASLEVARLLAEQKHMYINTFVHPSLPQEAKYPHRALNPLLLGLGLLGGWGLAFGLVVLVRNHMA